MNVSLCPRSGLRWPARFAALVAILAGTPAWAAPVTALAFAPDGSALVANAPRGLTMRSPTNGAVQRHIGVPWPRVVSLAFNPRGNHLAAGGGDPGASGGTLVLAWPEGTVRWQLPASGDVVTGLAFSPDGQWLVVASADHRIQAWRIGSSNPPALQWTVDAHAGPVLALGFSPAGDLLVSAGADRSVKVWSPADGRLVRSLGQHTEAVHALAFRHAPGHERGPAECATAGDDRTVRVWQPGLGRMVRIVRAHEGSVLALAYNRDGTRLFTAGREGIIRVVDATSDRILHQLAPQSDWIYALAVSPDGRRLASGDWAGRVVVQETPGPAAGVSREP